MFLTKGGFLRQLCLNYISLYRLIAHFYRFYLKQPLYFYLGLSNTVIEQIPPFLVLMEGFP